MNFAQMRRAVQVARLTGPKVDRDHHRNFIYRYAAPLFRPPLSNETVDRWLDEMEGLNAYCAGVKLSELVRIEEARRS